MRHTPQHPAPGELPGDCRIPIRRGRDGHQPSVVGVFGEVGVVDPEDIVGTAARDVGAQGVKVGGIGHQGGADLDPGVFAAELGKRLAIGGGHLLVPQSHRDDGFTGRVGGAAKQYRKTGEHRTDGE